MHVEAEVDIGTDTHREEGHLHQDQESITHETMHEQHETVTSQQTTTATENNSASGGKIVVERHTQNPAENAYKLWSLQSSRSHSAAHPKALCLDQQLSFSKALLGLIKACLVTLRLFLLLHW